MIGKPAFMAPRGAVANKPPHGQPCNRCGLCCIDSLCPLAQHVFGFEFGPCPALSFDAGGSTCGLVAAPATHALRKTLENGLAAMSEAAAHLIGAGHGCDARINDEPPDESFCRRLEELDRQKRAQTRVARKLWGL
jgi:hypothetical protein